MKGIKNNSQLLIKLGQNLKAFRKKKGLSQEQLSELAGLHPTYVSQLETGKANPSMVILIAVAEQLDITIIDLLRGSAVSEDNAMFTELREIFDSSDDKTKTRILAMVDGIIKAYKEN